MGSFFTKVFSKLSGKKQLKIIIIGLDNSGKTTILNKLHLNEVKQTVPTIGFNMQTVEYKNLKFQVWDLGGQNSIRFNIYLFIDSIGKCIILLQMLFYMQLIVKISKDFQKHLNSLQKFQTNKFQKLFLYLFQQINKICQILLHKKILVKFLDCQRLKIEIGQYINVLLQRGLDQIKVWIGQFKNQQGIIESCNQNFVFKYYFILQKQKKLFNLLKIIKFNPNIQKMSDQTPQKNINQHQNKQAKIKDEKQKAKQKSNTDAWLKKQQEKKKKKQQQTNNPAENDKAKQKAKKKQLKKQQQKADQAPQVKVQQENVKNEKKQEKKKKSEQKAKKQVVNEVNIKKTSQIIQIPKQSGPEFFQLKTLRDHLLPKFLTPHSSQLIEKYLQVLLTPSDLILILSPIDKWSPSICPRIYPYPMQQSYIKNSSQSINCFYEDLPMVMNKVTKVFVRLEVVFANGFALVNKGDGMVVALASQFKVPVVGYCPTTSFNAANFLSTDVFINKYGEAQLLKYDIIQPQDMEIIVLEIGSVIPRQVSAHIESLTKIYKILDLNSIQW